MLNIHDMKVALREDERPSDRQSTVYGLVSRHG
jgi:hypothetical protein